MRFVDVNSSVFSPGNVVAMEANTWLSIRGISVNASFFIFVFAGELAKESKSKLMSKSCVLEP